MDGLVFFGTFSLAIVRGIGVLVSLDFLLDRKRFSEQKFYLFLLGWLFWFSSSIVSVVHLLVTESNLLGSIATILHDVLVLLGSFYLILAVLTYFTQVSNTTMIIGTFTIISVPTILSLIFGLIIANFILLLIFLALFFSLVTNMRSHHSKLTFLIGRSANWLYLTSLFSFLYILILSFMVLTHEETDITAISDPTLFSLYSFISLTVTLLILVLSIHLEYSLNYIQSYRLKDQYSHRLGNILQMILNSAEAKDLSMNGFIIEKCEEAKYLITEIRDL